MDNLFLQIVRREKPSYGVYEDEQVYAFLDIEPHSKGHTLVVPKRPCADIEEIDGPLGATILLAAQKVVKALRTLYDYEGVVLHQVNGEQAQEIRHFHLHVYGTLRIDDEQYFKQLPINEKKRHEQLEQIATEISQFIREIE
jgi:histidine triad (HIT) family protein